MFKILVTEDDKSTAKLMRLILCREGYDVILAYNGAQALEMLDKYVVDLIVLDVMMPKMDGYEFTETVRANNNNIPILMVTAKPEMEDKFKGFISGADDYMIKPVNETELILRIKALLRRSQIANERKIVIGDVTLDYNSMSVTKNGVSQDIPKKEFCLLFKLLSSPGQIFTRIQLMDEIWGLDSSSGDTTVNVHINRLRNKFSQYPDFSIITVKGVGYKAVINNEKD